MFPRCIVCHIGIFRNADHARIYGKVFDEIVNLRVGQKCIGCATIDGKSVEEAVDLFPAKPKRKKIVGKAVKAAHKDYMNGTDSVAKVAKRHGIGNLLDQFKLHGLPRRKPGPNNKANERRKEVW